MNTSPKVHPQTRQLSQQTFPHDTTPYSLSASHARQVIQKLIELHARNAFIPQPNRSQQCAKTAPTICIIREEYTCRGRAKIKKKNKLKTETTSTTESKQSVVIFHTPLPLPLNYFYFSDFSNIL